MKNFICVIFLIIFLNGCATHRPYDMGQIREREIEYKEIALDKDGLTREQIDAISSTKPPSSFPVDISIIILKNGYIDSVIEDIFSYNLIKILSKSQKINRVTLIPDFLIPYPLNFNSIQELGVRSLSEYVLVFNLNSREFFNWTKILESKFEINSSINYILVDSFTSAMLTADKLHSKQEYTSNLLKLEERRKAQEIIFSEQAELLANMIDKLFDKNQTVKN